MDDLLPILLSFPPHPPPLNPISDQQYDEGITSQIKSLKGVAKKDLLRLTSGGENVLDVINPALNTAPYIFILLAHIASQSKASKSMEMDKLWQKMTTFLETFDPRQIRHLGHELSQVIDALATFARRSRQSSIAIPPIRDAILRLDPSGSILTSSHLTLVKLALESQHFAPIVPVLEKFIFYFPGTTIQPQSKYICAVGLPGHAYITPGSGLTSKLKYQEILEYFIYSATVFIGLRNWEMASDCLENVICYPVKENGVSKIMVEAYKKWVLVNLMLEGKPISLPSTTNNTAAKLYRVIAKPYDTIATLFESASAARLKAEADFGQSVWRDDGNNGLVLHVLAAYQKFQIRNLANIYSKISIPEVINLTTSAETGNRLPSPQAAETLVENMIAEGSLHAILSRSPNQPAVLTFTNGPVLSEAETQRELAGSMDCLHALTQEITETNRRLTHEKEYIKYVQKQKKNAGYSLRDGAIGSSGMDMDWNDIEDEDLMTSGI